MSETSKASILATEKQLSHVNARLADTMEILKQSATSIKFACAIISELQNKVEDIYLSLEDDDTANAEVIVTPKAGEATAV